MIYDHERKPKAAYKGPPARMPVPSQSPMVIKDAVRYLKNRGLDPAAAGFNLWYPTAWDVPRIVIPCSNATDEVYFQARRIDDSNELRYRSPQAAESAIRSAIVLCWPRFKAKHSSAVIVEGPLDALAAACCGFVGVGLMGNQPPPERLQYIVKMLGVVRVPFLVVPDLDNQEFGASLAAVFAMQGVPSRVVMPTKKDLCDMDPADRLELLTTAMGEKIIRAIPKEVTSGRRKRKSKK